LETSLKVIDSNRYTPLCWDSKGKNELGIINKWFLQHRNQTRYIDFYNLLNYLRFSGRLPIVVRIGGYDRAVDYGFLSRDRHPYDRSFNIQGNIAVFMGWSCRGDRFLLDLDRLRLEGQNFNILHKYYQSINSVDNDFYLRLGMFQDKLFDREIDSIEQQVKNYLRSLTPLYLSVDIDSISFTYYQDEFLTPETTRVIPLKTATPEELQAVYPPMD
jgi:hypothetical protein